ncbi:hypothetical protein tinsulaeT_36450 [Thalassotalea insulae]|uniref:Citrate synthase n=1 Tax=Thalassotalea insulae TaxID=2056778 RepID=A0ABQ6H0N7_9GAMM|nr:hypothetical protein [Thalassotalea insulae]GLX80305.1 hypothetical protein tinsulaeT_36450 [Thalassotalea insulae]
MLGKKKNSEQRTDFVYAGKTQTKILLEQPSESNHYISQKSYLYGYDVAQLISKKSFAETLLLLFTGELPAAANARLLERLMIALINLGPRHPAVKASMTAGVSKSNAEHLLPIGLSVLGGKENGAQEVAEAISFIYANIDKSPQFLADSLLKESAEELAQHSGEFHLVAGFGNYYGSIDELTQAHADAVLSPTVEDKDQHCTYIDWGLAFVERLESANIGILKTGLAAMVFCHLGIAAREAVGLYQLLCAPGIFAHGVEQTHKPITAMPMLSDEQHFYQQQQTLVGDRANDK